MLSLSDRSCAQPELGRSPGRALVLLGGPRGRSGLAGRGLRGACCTGTTLLGHDTSLFRRLVLGWIEADFRVQIRIFQHFSKSTRKSPSREQILEISAKKLENFAEILTFFGKFCKILQKFQKSAKFLQNFFEFFADFYRNV